MAFDYFFDIPVYRCTKDRYEQELEEEKRKLFNDCGRSLDEPLELIQSLLDCYNERIWEPWHYNQVIGWLRLFIMGNQIRTDYFKLSHKKLVRKMKHKKFLYHGSYLLTEFHHNDTSSEIYNNLLTEIKHLSTAGQFKKRHIDLELFKRTISCIDWKVFLDKE